jgi:hypothetical protein
VMIIGGAGAAGTAAALAGTLTTVGPDAVEPPAAAVLAGGCGAATGVGTPVAAKLRVTLLSNTASSGIGRDLRTAALPTSGETVLSSRNCTST